MQLSYIYVLTGMHVARTLQTCLHCLQSSIWLCLWSMFELLVFLCFLSYFFVIQIYEMEFCIYSHGRLMDLSKIFKLVMIVFKFFFWTRILLVGWVRNCWFSTFLLIAIVCIGISVYLLAYRISGDFPSMLMLLTWTFSYMHM